MPSATDSLPEQAHPLQDLTKIISKNVDDLVSSEHVEAKAKLLNGHHKSRLDSGTARAELLSACRTLVRTVTGPTELLKNMALIDKHNLVSLQVINHFRLANLVPTKGEIGFGEIASKCGLQIGILTRILRQAMTYDVFQEPKMGFIAHTPTSLEIPRLSPLLTYQLEICLPSTLGLLSWLKQHDGKAKAPFQIAHRTDDSWWTYAENRPDLVRAYGEYMALITDGGPHDVNHVVSGFDWEKLGSALVIDIGGADAFVGVTIAQAFPRLSVIVQDSGHLKESADAKIPLEMKGRVAFFPHSFFDPQEAIGSCADVFLLRHILHDWDDEECMTILGHLTACMKSGARIIVAEQVLSTPGTIDPNTDRVMRALDMQMMVQFGGKERTLEDWEALFKAADPTIHLIECVQPSGSADSLLELQKRD